MIGRTAELDILLSRAEAARAGRAQAALIRGPAGIGKSTLLEAVREAKQSRGMTVLQASCRETASGYGAVRDLFAPLRLTSEDAEGYPLLPDSAREAFLSPGTRTRGPGPSPGAETPDSETYEIFEGLYRLAVTVMADQPLLIMLDDVHRADAPSLRWVNFLLRRSADLPLLVLLALRSGPHDAAEPVLAEIAGQPRCHIMDLTPLSDVGIAAVVEHVMSEPPTPAFQRFCVQVSGGTPLVLSHLLGELKRQGIRPDEAGARQAKQIAGTVLASSISVLLDALPAYVREVAMAAAVLGETDAGLLGALSGVPASQVTTALDALLRNNILTPTQERFAHGLLRSAVLADVPAERLSELRATAARLLNDSGRPTEEVAGQIMALPEPNESWMVDVLLDAANQAEQQGALETAADYLDRVRTCTPGNVFIDLRLASTLANADPMAAIRHVEDVVERISDPRTRASSAQHLAMISLATRTSPKVFPLLERILHELDAEIGATPCAADRELRMFAEANLLAAGLDQRSTVTQALARARTLPVPSGDTPNERQLIGILAMTAAMEGTSVERAMDYARRVLRIQELAHTGLAQFGASFAAALADEGEMALAGFDWILADSRRRGAVWTQSVALAVRSYVLESSGKIDSAFADARAAMEIAEQQKWGPTAVWAQNSLATVLIKMGKPEQAEAVLDMVDLATVRETTMEYPRFLQARGHARWVTGDREGALEYMLQVGPSLEERGIRNPVFMPWWMDATCVLADLGRQAEAIRFAEHGEDLVRGWNTSRAVGFASLARGLVTPGRRGVHLLGEAVEALATSPARSYQARAECLFGRALLTIDDSKGARKHLRRAIDLSVRHGCRAIAEIARELLLSAGGRMRAIPSSPADGLTASERRVATLATEGLTNREIAEYLFVTVRTVEEHITSAFQKLGISSRADLPTALADRPGTAPAVHANSGL